MSPPPNEGDRVGQKKRSRLVIDSEDFGDPMSEIGLFARCQTLGETRAVLREQIEVETAAMLTAIGDADAFDVIELMRMREFAPVPDPRVVMSGSSGLVVEIVSAVLLSRPSRMPNGGSRADTRPHEAVTELHKRAKRIARLATYRQQVDARMAGEPLARISAEYQGAVLNIRNLQYEHIRTNQEQRLFRHPIVSELMRGHLGYTYDDVVAVREGLDAVTAERMTSLRDETADIMLAYRDTPPEMVPTEAVETFRLAMTEFMFLPGARATFLGSDVASAARIDEDVVLRVLQSYSQTFSAENDAGTRVYDMLTGTNPFLVTPLLTDGAGGFASTVNAPGLDSLRRILEKALVPHQSAMRRYDKQARQPVSETLAIESLERGLDCVAAQTNFEYLAPKEGVKPAALNASCRDLNAVANQVEGDGLFVVDDVAIVVEVKAKSVAAQARRGDVRRLKSDLDATIGDANRQAMRLQTLIETNGGVWLNQSTWIDLSHVREVRSVVALLDDVGPIGVAIGDLQAAGLLASERPPWVVSTHDLEVISEIIDTPGELLLYLRRRTDTGVARYYRAVDELDLFMLFLDGGLYVEDDPDRVRDAHPTAPPLPARHRRKHEADSVSTRVLDHCGPLDEWFSRHLIPDGAHRPEKPRFTQSADIEGIIRMVHELTRPGWLRFEADVLGLAGDAQHRIVKEMRRLRRRAASDSEYHDMFTSFAGMWGHPSLFAGIVPHPQTIAVCR